MTSRLANDNCEPLGTISTVALLEQLMETLLGAAGSHASRAAATRNEFRQALIDDLRRYSILIEEVRQRFLLVHDDLETAAARSGNESTDARLLSSLEDEYEADRVMVLPPDLTAALAELPRDAGSGRDARAQIEEAVSRLEKLDGAWAPIRPRLDEALEANAIAFLRTYRHEFRRLAQRALWILHELEPGPQSEPLMRMYVEAVLWAADQWNAHIVGTIGELRGERAV